MILMDNLFQMERCLLLYALNLLYYTFIYIRISEGTFPGHMNRDSGRDWGSPHRLTNRFKTGVL